MSALAAEEDEEEECELVEAQEEDHGQVGRWEREANITIQR
jgi:hypothetical protein